MTDPLGEIIIYAAAVALSPLPIVIAVVVLGSDRGRHLGTAYLLGWVGGLGALCGLVLVVLPRQGREPSSPAWLAWLDVSIGVLAIAVGLATWWARAAQGPRVAEPRWLGAADTMTARRAWGIGIVVSLANPKIIPIALATVASLSASGIGTAARAAGLALFVIVGSIGVATPLLIAIAAANRAPAALARFHTLAATRGHLVLTPLFLIVGAILVYEGLTSLA